MGARLTATALIAAATTLPACGSSSKPTSTTTAAATGGCAQVAAPGGGRITGPPARRPALARNRHWSLVFETSCGNFTVALDPRSAPHATASMVALARDGYFNNTVFHRIVPGFVIQGGDPTARGTGGPGYSTVDRPPAGTRYTRGVVAMAKTQAEGPGTAGSQFYVVTAADAGLPPEYAVIGRVSSGLDTVDRIARLGDPASGGQGTPLRPVVVRAVAVHETSRAAVLSCESMVVDVDEAGFHQAVIERSRVLPVVVDFWAAWCGPCRALSPALEQAAAAREGEVELAKVDVDRNQRLAASYRVQGIPAVKAFRDGRVVDEFTGALPAAQVERFFDRLVPSRAERALATGDEDSLREAFREDPRNSALATALARMLIERGEREQATAILQPFEHDFLAAGLAARLRLEADPPDERVTAAFSAWDAGEHAGALELLQEAFADAGDAETRELVRRALIGLFTELGPDSELAREHRRRLSAVLF